MPSSRAASLPCHTDVGDAILTLLGREGCCWRRPPAAVCSAELGPAAEAASAKPPADAASAPPASKPPAAAAGAALQPPAKAASKAAKPAKPASKPPAKSPPAAAAAKPPAKPASRPAPKSAASRPAKAASKPPTEPSPEAAAAGQWSQPVVGAEVFCLLERAAEKKMRQGDVAGACELYQHLLDDLELLHGTSHTDIARVKRLLAIALRKKGDLDSALVQIQGALAMETDLLGTDHPATAASLQTLGVLLAQTGDPCEALRVYRQALRIQTAAYGRDSADVATTLCNMASVNHARGKHAEALKQLRQAIVIEEKHDKVAAATTRGMIGAVLLELFTRDGRSNAAQIDEAEREIRDAMAFQSTVLGPRHPDTMHSAANLGILLSRRNSAGAATEARRLFLTVVAVLTKSGGPKPTIAVAERNLAGLHEKSGDLEACLRGHRRALGLRLEALGESHAKTFHSALDVAQTLQKLGRDAEAQEAFRVALRLSLVSGTRPPAGVDLDRLAGVPAQPTVLPWRRSSPDESALTVPGPEAASSCGVTTVAADVTADEVREMLIGAGVRSPAVALLHAQGIDGAALMMLSPEDMADGGQLDLKDDRTRDSVLAVQQNLRSRLLAPSSQGLSDCHFLDGSAVRTGAATAGTGGRSTPPRR
eukprot:TRINITY_DN9697_c0_g1_i2.p1 TRINITY_DN9697_c0_g1~~TRINITY_DN9697_c0_g1_i2.p1  ORF type:complete len:652 (+),score=172.63 TRINITY_DN9697_c0_g1_i2:70-2025(+)